MQLKHNWDFFGHRKVFYTIPLVIFAIILIFALGAGTGFKLAESLAYHTIWVCCLLLMPRLLLC